MTQTKNKPGARRSLTAADAPMPEEPVVNGNDLGSAMLCLIPDPALAAQLAVPGGQPPESLHVTLVYLGPVAELGVERADVEDLISETLAAMLSVGDEDGDASGTPGVVDPDEDGDADSDTLSGVFNGMARFTPDPEKGTPIVTTLDAPGLGQLVDTLSEVLRENFDLPAPNHGLVPHVTLIWRSDIGPDDPVELPPPSGASAIFTSIALAWGDVSDPANITVFPLDGSPAAVSAPSSDATVMRSRFAEGDQAAPAGPAETGRVIPQAGPLGTWIACLATEGVPTDEMWEGDDGMVVFGRLLPPGVVAFREPPLPGGFAMDDMGNPADNGHRGAPTAMAATKIWRDGTAIMATGPYLDNLAGMAAKQAIDSGAPVAPSIALGGAGSVIEVGPDGKAHETLVAGTLSGFAVLPFEAMHAAPDGTWTSWIRSVPGSEVTSTLSGAEGGDEAAPPEPLVASAFGLPDAVEIPSVTVSVTADALCGCGSDEGSERFGAPLYPPKAAFFRPEPEDYTPLTVTADGEVYGFAAGGTCHIGIPGTCVKPTDGMLDTDFSAFHKGLDDASRGIQTAEGELVQVGQITLSGGHAHEGLSANAAKRHYDETKAAIANVRVVWSERHGAPFFAGALTYGATKADVQTLRAIGHVSVDYRRLMADGSAARRPNEGKLRLIGLPAVPVGGFPPIKAFRAAGELQTWIMTPQEGEQMEVIGDTGLPVADRDVPWDGSKASQAVAKLCPGTNGDNIDPACYGRAFLYRDDSQPPGNVGSYHLGFADVINGQLEIVYAGVSAAAGRLDQTDMPADAKDQVKGKLNALYAACAKKFNDPTVKPPWEMGATSMEFATDTPADAPNDPTAQAAPAGTDDAAPGEPPKTPPPGTIPYVPEPYAKEDSETATCMTCGRGNDPDAQCCDQCGASLTPTAAYAADDGDTIQCPVCGLMNAPDAAYCDQDGTELVGRKDVGPDALPTTDEATAAEPAGPPALTADAMLLELIADACDRKMDDAARDLARIHAEEAERADRFVGV